MQTLSRSQYVFNTIKDAIFSAQLKSGSPLTELHLAHEFEVSQSTIREALSQLEKVGLVVKVPHKGTFVTEMSDEEIQQRLTVRYKLEELACTQAALNMNDNDFKNLNTILARFNEMLAKESYFEITQVDLEFHRFIWKCSNNSVLYNTLDQISVPLFAFISIQRSIDKQNMMKVYVPHEKIVHAIESRDETLIVETIRSDALQSYVQYLKK